jgi:hypothetical protein
MGERKTESELIIERELEAKRRADNCLVDIRNALRKWNCKVEPVVQIVGKEIRTSFLIAPLTLLKV